MRRSLRSMRPTTMHAWRLDTQLPQGIGTHQELEMKTRAAVAFAAKQPLEIVEVDLEGPKAGEVLVEIMATGICHTDAYTLDGLDSEGLFPSILGHEGAGIVREVGPGVTSVKPGDHVIPLYTPECRQCKSCLSGKTNLCTAIRATQGKGADARRHQPLQLQGRDRSSITWAARPSRTSPCCPRSRSRRSARTRRSRPAATSAAASPPASARWSTPPRSSPAPTSSCSASAASGSTSSRARSWSART